MVDGIRQVARFCGYAIGEHGSKARDLDLIAVAWVDWAVEPQRLIDALVSALDLHVALDETRLTKPHGRLGWNLIAFGAAGWYKQGPYRDPRVIDLSVIGPQREPPVC